MQEIEDPQYPFKFKSLSLFGKQVRVRLRSDCKACSYHGEYISGKLSGRTWGKQVTEEGKYFETVVAITITTSEQNKITIHYQDIISLDDDLHV